MSYMNLVPMSASSLRSMLFFPAFSVYLILFYKPVILCSRVKTEVNRFYNLEMGTLSLLLGLGQGFELI